MKIGIDLGGSHIAVGTINENFEIIEKIDENLKKEEKENLNTLLVPKLEEKIKKIAENEKIEKIGIACPRNNKKWDNMQSWKFKVKKLSIKRIATRKISKYTNRYKK